MSNVQMVDLYGQYQEIKEEVDAAIQEVIDDTAFVKGKAVEDFEDDLAQYLEGTYAIGINSGTDALQIAFMAHDIGQGDEFITTPFSFIATAEAPALLGATPVFVDIDPETYNLDVEQIEEKITPDTKAIVPVHLYGQPAEMDAIMDLAEKYDLAVIEDVCQAIGSRYRGAMTGYIGDVGCLSFHPSKNLGAFGDGGAILTNDEELHDRMRMIANHGASKKYHNEILGVNSRLDTIQAAVLQVKLRHLDAYTEARRDAAHRYDQYFSEHPTIITPTHAPNRTHVYHQYTIRFDTEDPSYRDRVTEHLDEKGLPYSVFYPVPMHKLPVFTKIADDVPSLPRVEEISKQVVSLPMHTELTVEDQDEVASAIVNFVQDNPA